ncbi:MAG: hypothetical protein HY552_04125 [Elusimicrobia bacterium]|nr:hypothetical protein [Elusimicrobiota bacterium]
MPLLKRAFIITAAILAVSSARAQEGGGAPAAASRSMRNAIRFYEKGDDIQAMDRFMEILTKGAPAERSMANEYINLITRRMNMAEEGRLPAPGASDAGFGGGQVVGAQAPARSAPAASLGELEPGPARPAAPRKPSPRVDGASSADSALARREILARLRVAQERSLSDLRAIEGVQASARADGAPQAIGLPSELLFKSGIAFRRDAARVLGPLTRLAFASGNAQIMILPEGAAFGDAKVLDMRRVMGLSAGLFDAGIAPARVRVNLLNAQVGIPKALLHFKGILIVFLYDEPLRLSAESAASEELGPPLSLGVFPSRLRPSRNEGGIIEFSISEPPAGLASWTFKLLQVSTAAPAPAPLQEVSGAGPAFHQIFWNGRRDYFGDPLPAGRYECVLSARDAKNRTRTLRRWIQLSDDEAVLAAPASVPAGAAPAKPAARRGAPSAELSGAAPKPRPRSRPTRRARRRALPSRTPAGAGGAPTKAAPAAEPGRYRLEFLRNAYQMTASGEQALAAAAQEAAAGPLAAVTVAGGAAADEADAAALAQQRARMVAGLLINRYQIDPKTIRLSTAAPNGSPRVELTLSRSGR